jgi:cephalosporin hydroxylase
MGVPAYKCPLDLWIYQEILYDLRPDLIIETGTAAGGSALFLAHMCDLIGKGRIISVDVQNAPKRPKHRRVEYWLASSTAPETIKKIASRVKRSYKVLAIFDSDHSKEHVLKELNLYWQFVTPGSYMIVEDSNLNGHPVFPTFGPGPMEAIEEFLQHNAAFTIDLEKEKFYLTQNPKGFLKRI